MFNIFFSLVLLFNYANSQIRGVSLGSLYVLEPFITPHLFYQFLGNNDKIIGDTYSLCEYLGPYKTNKLLKNHWNDWINEKIIDTIYQSGINTIRIPVGDYMYLPYGPYSIIENGVTCFDGVLEHLDTILKYISKYDIKIIIDVHALKESQNGFDNSGQTKNIETTFINNTLYYNHWSIRSANWIGNYDLINKEYITINYENIDLTLTVINIILNKYKDYPNIWGLCPINEPWENTPEDILKYFYKKVYDSFIQIWEHKRVLIFHDSFCPFLWTSCDFIDLDKNNIKIDIYLDTHQYKAWNDPVSFDILISSIKNWNYPETCFKVIIGEFSLATDNCQMWLNGFMDNLPNYPLQPCYYEKCPRLNEGNNKYYIKKAIYGPFGSGESYPLLNGFCPVTTPIYLNKKISNTNLSYEKKDIFIYNSNHEYEKEYATTIYKELTTIFENKTVGWIFWNFRTSSNSYSWNYLSLYNIGYIDNKYNSINEINKKTKVTIFAKIYLIILPIIIFIIYCFQYYRNSLLFYGKNKTNVKYKPININSNKNYGSNDTEMSMHGCVFSKELCSNENSDESSLISRFFSGNNSLSKHGSDKFIVNSSLYSYENKLNKDNNYNTSINI